MGTRTGLATGSAMSLTTAYSVASLSPLPDVCELAWLRGALTSISGASRVTWCLAADAAGDIPLTDEILVDIVVGATTSSKGGVSSSLDLDYAPDPSGVTSAIYVVAKTDAGTATMAPSLVFSEDV